MKSPRVTSGPPLLSSPEFTYGRTKTINEIVGIPPEMPISLYSLPDPRPGEKPDYTYAALVKIAIWESPEKRLTLQEIYDAIEQRFSWFRDCNKQNSWKDSIRHALSLLSAFQRVPRNKPGFGKGAYWTVDFTKGEGNKRPRKRNRKPKLDASGGLEQLSARSSQEREETASEIDPDGLAEVANIDPISSMDPTSKEMDSHKPGRSSESSENPQLALSVPYSSPLRSSSVGCSPLERFPEAVEIIRLKTIQTSGSPSSATRRTRRPFDHCI